MSKNNRRKNKHINNKNYKKTDNSLSQSSYTREKRHQDLYDTDFNITKQQVFNFDEMSFSDELDTSFVESKRKKREQIIEELNSSYEKDENKREHREIRKKPKVRIGRMVVFVFVCVLLLFLIGVGVYSLFIPPKEKIVTKEKTIVVVDDNYLFLGDSLTEYYDLDKYYKDLPVVNSGISGNITEDILNDMDHRVYQYNPSKVFLLIGTNDIQKGISSSEIVDHIKEILTDIHDNRPYAELYLESLYPVDEDKDASRDRTNEEIIEINKKLKKYCKDKDIVYIDLFQELVDEEDEDIRIKDEYSEDGLHLTDEGYEVVTNKIMKYLKEEE
ncbi:MAG TPA: hypothetical protein IAB35_04695 [Candidatus Faecimonas gallistercoris]|nr:hypothetical protein [Candidatus Faecimonas gallistercoris]